MSNRSSSKASKVVPVLNDGLPSVVIVDRSKRKDWSDRDITLLIRDYATRDTVELARELGVTVDAVRGMARRHGVSKTKEYMSSISRKGFEAAKDICGWKSWSDRDIELLIRDYADRDTFQLARELGRTPRSVRRMARKLGVFKTHEYMSSVSQKGAAAANAIPPELKEVIRLTNRIRRVIHEQS